jgi:hypothetical protein
MTETPQNGKAKKQSGRLTFFACREAIRAELERGATMLSVYQTRAEALGISYAQFTRHVNVYIRGKPQKPRGKRQAAVAEGEQSRAAASKPSYPLGASNNLPRPAHALGTEPRSLARPELPSFHYDPMDAFRKSK